MADSTPRRPARPRPAGLPTPSPSAIMAASGGAASAGAARPGPSSAHLGGSEAAPTPAERDALLERAGSALVDLLDRQEAVHRRLLEHFQDKREAIRRADLDRVAACCAAEQQILAEIQRLEAQRSSVVAGVTTLLEPGRTEPMPLTDITPHLPAPVGERLLDLRAKLRSSLEEAGRLSTILTAAAEAVGTHLAGLVQTLGTVLAGPGTYGRRGRVDTNANSPMRLDLTS